MKSTKALIVAFGIFLIIAGAMLLAGCGYSPGFGGVALTDIPAAAEEADDATHEGLLGADGILYFHYLGIADEEQLAHMGLDAQTPEEVQKFRDASMLEVSEDVPPPWRPQWLHDELVERKITKFYPYPGGLGLWLEDPAPADFSKAGGGGRVIYVNGRTVTISSNSIHVRPR